VEVAAELPAAEQPPAKPAGAPASEAVTEEGSKPPAVQGSAVVESSPKPKPTKAPAVDGAAASAGDGAQAPAQQKQPQVQRQVEPARARPAAEKAAPAPAPAPAAARAGAGDMPEPPMPLNVPDENGWMLAYSKREQRFYCESHACWTPAESDGVAVLTQHVPCRISPQTIIPRADSLSGKHRQVYQR
jgi:hypothetical protein